MNTPLLPDLLQTVHKFYPVGMPHIVHQFEGYQKLKSIIHDKIESLGKKEGLGSWDNLIIGIKDTFPSYEFLDMSYRQFPNLMLSLELVGHKWSCYEVKSNLVLCISLLGNYYTSFISDQIVSIPYNSNSFFCFWRNASNPQEAVLIEDLQNLVESNFTNHRSIDITILSNNFVKGAIPHGLDDEDSRNEYSLYEFLFDSSDSWMKKNTLKFK